MKDLREAMRMGLALGGIVLDEPAAKPKPVEKPKPEPVQLDRGKIRRILLERGAPEKDLRWLTISCPSYADAMQYTPPRKP